MEFRDALRWAGRYRALATVSFLAGAAIAGVGLVVGAPGIVDAATGPGTVTGALGDADPVVVAPALVVGTLVWQVGAAAAYVRTMTGATEAELADRFDTERVKSDILSVLDDRLAEMQTELEETRRSVDSIKRETKAASFDEFEE